MDLAAYFEKNDGIGILATCDTEGKVNQAVYSKPLVIDSQTIALVMKQRISHQNLRKNLYACYLFLEKTPGYKGVRLYLTMQREETNRSLVNLIRKQSPDISPDEDDSDMFFVFFNVDRIRPLVGDGPI